jgi:hypothetical protein
MGSRVNLLFLLFITIFNNSCAQENSEEHSAIELVKMFYTARSTIHFTLSDLGKIESLQNKYCTKKLLKRLNENFQLTGLDHDLLTKDYGIDSLGLKTLTVLKDQAQGNVYVVAYTILDDAPDLSKVEVNVTLYVTVKKEEGSLKIDDIK